LQSFHSKKKNGLELPKCLTRKEKFMDKKTERRQEQINKNLSKNFYTDPEFGGGGSAWF
jgi:hypothetical protein